MKEGTIAEVSLRLIRGGHNDERQGWTDGWVTQNSKGAAYLHCEFTIVSGLHAAQKFTDLIGLYTPKGSWWGNKGRKTIRDILNSTHELLDDDYSETALAARHLDSLGDLNGVSFIAELRRITCSDGFSSLHMAVTPPKHASGHIGLFPVI